MRYKLPFFLLFSLILLLLAGCGELPTSSTTSYDEAYVSRVVDGDTLVVQWNNKEERLRLIGVDTPETVHPTRGEEPYGKIASEYTTSRLENQTIQLEWDVEERDQYDRLLAYVWFEDELFNAKLVREGYAMVSTWPPNVKYVDTFTELQQEAREQNRGLWGVEEIRDQYTVGRYQVEPDEGTPIQPINVNTATLEELQLIPGVGESLAEKIIEEREQDPFKKPRDLTRVNGIGSKNVLEMLPHVTTAD